MKRVFTSIITLLTILLTMGTSHAQQQTLTVLCTVQDDWCIHMTEAFQKQSGIVTSFVRLSAGEAVARLNATKDNPEFSVWWGGPSDVYITAANNGLLEAYESPIAKQLDPQYIGKGNYWYGVYVGALGFCSNIKALDKLGIEAPSSWEDLLNPALKGQIAQAHIATSGTGFTAFWTNITLKAEQLEYPDGKPTDNSTAKGTGKGYDSEGKPTQAAIDATFDYYKQLTPNILQFTRSGSASGPMAGRGEIAVSIIFSHDCVKFQQEDFKDILALTFPKEGTGYEVGGVAVIAKGPETKAAQQFVDFALSPEGQKTGVDVKSYQIPTNPKTPIPALSVNLSQVTLVNYDAVTSGEIRSKLAERFDAEIAPRPAQ
jgi:iron(III) transport system substrate-binding protein